MNYANYSGFSAVPSCFHGGLCALSSSAVAETLFFFIFCFSAAAEMQFSSFLVHPPRRKRCFSHFLLFSRGGNDIFAVFYSSAMAESHFSSFSHFHPRMTSVFCLFFVFIRG
ncbi:MAG: hypothetical protein ACTTJ9_07100 [Segatella oris]|uniref:hypothetical protein n=1 Tax=Segatella oris TaxID=28135 RepID=UPI003FA1F34A